MIYMCIHLECHILYTIHILYTLHYTLYTIHLECHILTFIPFIKDRKVIISPLPEVSILSNAMYMPSYDIIMTS